MRTTGSYHEDEKSHHAAKKKTSCAMDSTAQHFSLFTFHFSFPTGKTFHFHKRELPYIAPIQCSTYGARMAVKMPLRVRPSEA